MPRALVVAWNKLRAVLSRSARERDMDEEMRFHVESEAAELRRAGLPADEALRRARATFGGIERFKEEGRDTVGMRLLDDLRHDVRYAVRQWRAAPGFTAATLATLALGIGATTIVYTLVATLSQHPFAFPNADRIIHIGQGRRGDQSVGYGRVSRGNYLTIRDQSRTLEDVALIGQWAPVLRGTDRATVVSGALVSPNFFHALGGGALLGRTLVTADSDSRGNVVVLSDGLWRTRFGGDSGIVGRQIVLDGAARTVVGVVAARLAYPLHTDVWAPRTPLPGDANDRIWTDFEVIARLRNGIDFPTARAELATIGAALAANFPAAMAGTTFDGVSLAQLTTEGSNDLAVFMAAVLLLLIVACSNLAGLLVARLTARGKEIAIRAAMGAGAGRLAAQLLTETLVLALAGSLFGVAIAEVGIRLIGANMPSFIVENVPGLTTMHADSKALAFSLGVGALTGLVIGLWPALRFSRPSLVGSLKDGARSSTVSGRLSRIRRGLVVAQVAFAIVLISAAGLLLRTTRNFYASPIGFRADHLLTLRTHTPPTADSAAAASSSAGEIDRIIERLGALPGVTRVGATFGLPYAHGWSSGRFSIVGRPTPAPGHVPFSALRPASADYFAAMEIPVLRGRAFARTDLTGSERVAVVNAAFARRFFPGENPLGQRLLIDSTEWQIVGVAADVGRSTGVQPTNVEIYRPMAQLRARRTTELVLRTSGEPTRLIPEVLRVIHEVDPDVALTNLSAMDALIADDRASLRVVLGLMAGFAIAALVISTIGLYALISYVVVQRTREFGIRRALGAGTRGLIALVVGQGARLAIAGTALGLAGAIAVTRLMRSMLFQVSPTDPASLGGAAAIMCVVGVLAAYLPARRATRVDPMVSLREE